MCNLKTGEPLEFEIIINSANGNSFTRVLLPFIENLRKIGIKATTRVLEINTYKNKLDNFDFDIIVGGFGGLYMPGSEQKDLGQPVGRHSGQQQHYWNKEPCRGRARTKADRNRRQ